MFRPHTAMSRNRLRGVATHRASGATPEVARTTAGDNFSRLRSAGAASPAATSAHAVARMALDLRKDRQYRFAPGAAAASEA